MFGSVPLSAPMAAFAPDPDIDQDKDRGALGPCLCCAVRGAGGPFLLRFAVVGRALYLSAKWEHPGKLLVL